MSRKTHHIVPNANGGWRVVKGGSRRASGIFRTKIEAEKAGRKISNNQRTEMIVHGKNGRIQRADSHGNDPHPPKDKS